MLKQQRALVVYRVEADCRTGNFADCISQTNPDGHCMRPLLALLPFRRGNGLAQYSGIAALCLAAMMATSASAVADRLPLTAY